MSQTNFKEKVLEVVKNIPKGKVMNYGQVALVIGFPRGAQAVGWLLHGVCEKDRVPWWRVINKEGRISTSCTSHTARQQKLLLEKEGLTINNLQLDLEKNRHWPSARQIKRMGLSGRRLWEIERQAASL